MTSILIIEDHPVYRDALCDKLSSDFLPHEIPVLSSSSVLKARTMLLKSGRQWVILLDLRLPDTDPIENIKALKELENVADVIVISGLEEESWRLKCLEAGADLFISKK